MSNLTLFFVLLAGCLAACSVPADAAVAPPNVKAGEAVVAVPGLSDDVDDNDDDAEMEVVDLDEVLESRAEEAAGPQVGTQGIKKALKKLKCKSGKCRKKCNAKGKNGACAGPVCVCWK